MKGYNNQTDRKNYNLDVEEEELKDIVILVFANKQDLPLARSVAEITDKLGLHSIRTREWYIQASCATTGDGLYEGYDWLTSHVPKTIDKTITISGKIPSLFDLSATFILENKIQWQGDNNLPKDVRVKLQQGFRRCDGYWCKNTFFGEGYGKLEHKLVTDSKTTSVVAYFCSSNCLRRSAFSSSFLRLSSSNF